MNSEWPFADSPNVAVITVTAILDQTKPILFVSHDFDDGVWQFLPGDPVHPDEAQVVALQTICQIDPSVYELVHLPEGWIAQRKNAQEPWHQSKHPGHANV